MSSRSGNSGCGILILGIFVLGLIIWLIGATLWVLQFLIPLGGALIAIGLVVSAIDGRRRLPRSQHLTDTHLAELRTIAAELEFRLTNIEDKWDEVARTLGVGTNYAEAFAAGEPSEELVQLRRELLQATEIRNRLASAGRTEDSEELVAAIAAADSLWVSLQLRYTEATR